MPRFDHRRLRPAREAVHKTQVQLAAEICKSPTTVARYEQGTLLPTVRVLCALAGALNVPVGDLFDPEDPNDPVAAYEAELTALVDAAPPLTAEQMTDLRRILQGAA